MFQPIDRVNGVRRKMLFVEEGSLDRVAESNQIDSRIPHTVDDHSRIARRAHDSRGVTCGAVESHKRDWRRSARFGAVRAEAHAEGQPFVHAVASPNKAELRYPVSCRPSRWLEVLRKKIRQNLKYRQRHEFRAGRSV